MYEYNDNVHRNVLACITYSILITSQQQQPAQTDYRRRTHTKLKLLHATACNLKKGAYVYNHLHAQKTLKFKFADETHIMYETKKALSCTAVHCICLHMHMQLHILACMFTLYFMKQGEQQDNIIFRGTYTRNQCAKFTTCTQYRRS